MNLVTSEPHTQAGKTAFAEWRFDEAETALRVALAADPDDFEAKAYLARTLDGRGLVDDAIALYRDVLETQPDNAAVHLLLAQSLLSVGRYAEGWAEYEWRYKGESGKPFPNIEAPAWQGETLDGRTLLVIGEQGYGDVMQFVRFVTEVKARGGRVSLACGAPLVKLLGGVRGIDHMFQDWHRVGTFDYHCPLSSLPGVLAVTGDDLPGAIPYITADGRLVRRWRGRVGSSAGRRIGLCWAGRATHPNDQFRSVPFRRLMAHLPDGHLYVSLQKGERAKDAAGSAVRDFDIRLNDFADTAALIHHLDLVITVDTSVAHLAGAMGRPVWVLLPYVADWRWGREGETTPWYPTARLFRQTSPRDWDSALAAVAAALQNWTWPGGNRV